MGRQTEYEKEKLSVNLSIRITETQAAKLKELHGRMDPVAGKVVDDQATAIRYLINEK